MGASAIVSVHATLAIACQAVLTGSSLCSTRDRVWAVYGASKTQGEQAAWQFVKENKPSFTVNTILPNANFGAVSRVRIYDWSAWLNPGHHGHRSSMPSSSQDRQQAGSEPSLRGTREG